MHGPGRIAYCDTCKDIVPRAKLVFRPVKYAMPKGMQNRLPWSYFPEGVTPAPWTVVGGSVDSYDSFGCHADPRVGREDAELASGKCGACHDRKP